MRVMHVISNLGAGGAEMSLARLAIRSRRDGATPMAVSLSGDGPVGEMLRGAGVPVHTLGMRSPIGTLRAMAGIRALIHDSRPDVVQTWMYHADLLGGLAARRARVPVVWNVRNTDVRGGGGLSRSTWWVMRACARLSRHVPATIICNSDRGRVEHVRLGYDPARLCVVDNGLEPLEAVPSRAAARGSLGLPATGLLVGSVGRFNPYKDHATMLAAFARLLGTIPNCHLAMAGAGVEAGNRTLVETIDRLGLARAVTLLGHLERPTDLYAAMDLLCLHSVSEGFPNVVAEAMRSARPCVVTDVGAAARIVGDTGLVAQPGDPAGLATAIGAALAEGPEALQERGRRAEARWRDLFSVDAMWRTYREIYLSSMRD